MDNHLANLLPNFLAALLYSLLGIALFTLGFLIFDRATPGSLWKELLDEHNTAVAILMGCVAIAIAIIIAAAIV